jgi:hypothetical protein
MGRLQLGGWQALSEKHDRIAPNDHFGQDFGALRKSPAKLLWRTGAGSVFGSVPNMASRL